MFLCGNMCTGGQMESEMPVKTVPLEHKSLLEAIATKCNRSKKNSHIMIKRSKYDQHMDNALLNKIKFTDKDFPPNEKSLNFSIPGRKIAWERVGNIVPDCIMVEDQFHPSDIQQGNIGDCYFLSSIAALAQVEERIDNIFHNNFKINQVGIYKIVVVKAGVPTQIVIDDYIPVFADTNRPVFCKATGRQIWVMLIEKAWAKIKGSYGAISAGCPHQVLQTFSVAPCYYYQIEEDHDEQYKNTVWDELVDSADQAMAVVAGTKPNVDLSGLQPAHAYTVLDCQNVKSNDKDFRIMRLRNPWGKTQYKGFACETDNQFWDGVDKVQQDRMRPAVGVNDGDFSMPFEEFLKNFNSIDISSSIFGFSYEFQTLKMYRAQPLFVKIDVHEAHEAFITVERKYGKGDTNQDVVTTNYGFSRLIIGKQRDGRYEYYDSMLETDFPDVTTYVKFKEGRYMMYVEVDDPRLPDNFDATLSYYYDTLEADQDGKNIQVLYQQKDFSHFLESIVLNHAIRMNNDPSKIGPKPEDWVKSLFMYQEGGFGYVVVNLQHNTNIRVSAAVNQNMIKSNGFYLMNDQPREKIVNAGEYAIYIFSCIFDGQKAQNYTFPPPGFRVSRIA